MARTYYKVVTPNKMSVCANFLCPTDKGMAIKYETSVWTSPKHKGSALFVFSSLKQACLFAQTESSMWHTLDIYECHIRGKRKHIPLFYSPGDEELMSKLQKLIKLKKSLKEFVRLNARKDAPRGTVSVNHVKLTKKIATYHDRILTYDNQ